MRDLILVFIMFGCVVVGIGAAVMGSSDWGYPFIVAGVLFAVVMP